ncbi:MAG: arginine--tRNA ligase [Coxiella sp. (in: Bacteria)]|nr:MAG: arginine--tRNA ligase [Coxiella sp. (in: g-proteobacteria)]
MKDNIAVLLQTALATLAEQNILSTDDIPVVLQIDHTKDPKHGDFSSNVALILAKKVGVAPREFAQKIIDNLPASGDISDVTIAGPGFINFSLAKDAHTQIIQDILKEGDDFGRSDVAKDQRIHIEYVSANPTGPLHVGHGRGAAYGSCVVNLLRAIGATVHNEYYVNDDGRQMDILAASVWLRYLELAGAKFAFPVNGYKGDYVYDIAREMEAKCGNALRVPIAEVFADVPEDAPDGDKETHIDGVIANAKKCLGAAYQDVFNIGLHTILDDIKEDLAEFGVTYDEWFSEKQLSDKHLIEHCFEVLTKAGHLYEKDGALWFRVTDFGDEKDRVVRRANGQTTYFASDIAYHLNKLERGNNTIINILGADHHGYIPRLKAGMTAMANRGDALVTPIVQFVSLFEDGEKVAMSTRGGQFVTLRELRQDVGNDAARYFYIMRKIDQPLDFDLTLAKTQSKDNQVYYIQYAHARVCRVFREMQNQGYTFDDAMGLANLQLLDSKEEHALSKQLQKYQEIVQKSALAYEPHVLAHYLYELATCYHSYYNANVKFLVEDGALRNARLCLNKATKQLIANGLLLLGLSAPEKM